MGRNDTPNTVERNRIKHAWNWEHPYPGFEFAIKAMVEGALAYSATYAMRYQVPISRDPVLGDEWLQIMRGLIGLLDGDTGRFHCPTVDGLLRATAEGAGFTLLLERRAGDPLAEDAELPQPDPTDD